jgi:hypothetical protein
MPFEHQAWEKVIRLSSLAGHPLEPGQTPTEYANSLQRRFRGLRGVSVIASVYARSRFGRSGPTPAERERVTDLWPPIRGELLRASGGASSPRAHHLVSYLIRAGGAAALSAARPSRPSALDVPHLTQVLGGVANAENSEDPPDSVLVSG